MLLVGGFCLYVLGGCTQTPHFGVGKMEGAGDIFQRQTKYDPDNMAAHTFVSRGQPSLYKQYPEAQKVELPDCAATETLTLHRALRTRKSVRRFSDRPLGPDRLSYLLWACTGIQRTEAGYEFRTAPSAGALYPVETYLVVNNADKIPSGLYHYAIRQHELEQLAQGDYSSQIAAAALGQGMCARAAVVFVWSAVFDRSKFKYGQRAYRYIYLDAGHIAENLALASVSIGLGSCQIGALYDDRVNAILALDGTAESVLYMSAVGEPVP